MSSVGNPRRNARKRIPPATRRRRLELLAGSPDGCTEALMLDGGISGQLALRDARGSLHRWPGMRSVPLGLVGRSKPQPSQQGKIRARSEISLYH